MAQCLERILFASQAVSRQRAQPGKTARGIILTLGAALLLVSCGAPAQSSNLLPQQAESASAPPTSVTPGPPPATSPTIVFKNVQQMTGWQTCGACGNTGGGGALAQFSLTRGITTPSLSGSSSEFAIGGGGSPAYTNGYWYIAHPGVTQQVATLIYSFDILVPAGDENTPQAIELECQQRINGRVYNFAWQAEYPSNRWRIFDYTLRRWDDSGIALQRFSPDTWHHIVAEYHTEGTTVVHDAISIDGARHVAGKRHSAMASSNTSPQFTNAFQLDLNSR